MLIDFSENSPKQKTCCTISIGNSYVNLTYKRHLGISHRGTPIWTPKKTAEKGKGNGLETKKKSGAPCMIRTCGPRFRKPLQTNSAPWLQAALSAKVPDFEPFFHIPHI